MHRPLLTFGVMLLLALSVSACAETGDFGRRRPGLFEGKRGPDLFPQRVESHYAWTDDETELRQRSVALLINPQKPQSPTLDVIEAEHGADSDVYFARLAGLTDQSIAARYRRVALNVADDAALIRPFRDVACRVVRADRVRKAALDVASSVSDSDAAEAQARIVDNATLIAKVEETLPRRAAMYHDALERLVISSPDRAAVQLERDIAGLRLVIAEDHSCAAEGPVLDKTPRKPIIRKG